MLIICYLITMLLSTIEGVTHEILYSKLGSNWSTNNEHIIFNIGRCTWGALLISGFFFGYLSMDLTTATIGGRLALYSVGSFLSFSFFHNGGYGAARNYRLHQGILKGWTYTSPTDTAKFSLDFANRFWLFAFGLCMILIGQFVIIDR